MDARPRQISPQSFGRRLHELVSEPDCSLVWFLGAGCSISSGIPGAADLVRQWLPRLKRREEGDEAGWEEWAKTRFELLDPAQPALLYGAVIDELFPLPRERQQEVERLTSAKEPSVGYALLAVLMAHEEYGERTNIVVTTNFDDLMADSLYLLTEKKPLVVVHESLAPYARPSRSRPLIVKVHGDARLAPRNTPDETANLDAELRSRVTSLLQGSGLVFCGYGGNDHSIAGLIRAAAPDAFPLGIYWVGTNMPTGPVGPALGERTGLFHVPQGDFDALMLNVADALGLTLPGFDRWRSLFDTYEQALTKQAKAAVAAEEPQQKKTADRLRTQLDAWRLAADARAVHESDPDRAEELYRQAVDTDPTNASILGNYAVFLQRTRRDPERAEELFRRAIEIDPNHAINLGNYALFLHRVRPDPERAEELFRRAIDLHPNQANNLTNYAVFLQEVGRDPERAEELFRRAIEVDPNHASSLANYALFLERVGRDPERAEELLRRAIEIDPDNAGILSNYASFLQDVGRDPERAEEFFRRAIEIDPTNPVILSNYAVFLQEVGRDPEHAEELFRRAIEAAPDNAGILGNYALFLQRVRQDPERADELFRRAIEADPTNADNLGAYALFLREVGRDPERAEELLRRAIEADPNHATNLGNYAQLLFAQRRDDEAVGYVDRALSQADVSADVRLEIAFYLYAHVPARQQEGMQQLVSLLSAGERSEGWDFTPNLERLKEEGDGRHTFLAALADVINGHKPLEDLEQFDEWRNASG